MHTPTTTTTFKFVNFSKSYSRKQKYTVEKQRLTSTAAWQWYVMSATHRLVNCHWLVFNGTFSTKRLYRAMWQSSLLKILISD